MKAGGVHVIDNTYKWDKDTRRQHLQARKRLLDDKDS